MDSVGVDHELFRETKLEPEIALLVAQAEREDAGRLIIEVRGHGFCLTLGAQLCEAAAVKRSVGTCRNPALVILSPLLPTATSHMSLAALHE